MLSGIEERDKNYREWDEHSDADGKNSFPEIHYLSCSAVLSAGFSCIAFAFTNSLEPAFESSAADKRFFLYLLVFVSKGDTRYFLCSACSTQLACV